MKSFQVVDFNAPLKEVDQPTPEPPSAELEDTVTLEPLTFALAAGAVI